MESLEGDILQFEFSYENFDGDIIIDLPCFKDNIEYVSEGGIDDLSRVILSGDAKSVRIKLKKIDYEKNLLYRKGVRMKIRPTDDGNFMNCTNGDVIHYTCPEVGGNYSMLMDIGKPVKLNRIAVFTDSKKYARKFNIDFSIDGKNFITIVEESRNEGKPKSYIFDSAITRYVRFTPIESVGEDENGGHRLRLMECYYDEV